MLRGHKCGPAEKCLSSENCGFIEFHPDEKQKQWASKKQETEAKNARKKEEKRERKRQKEELLWVDADSDYDTFWEAELARVIESDSEKYGNEAGTKKRATVMIQVTKNFKALCEKLKQQQEQIKEIKEGAIKKVFESPEEELEYLKQKIAELDK